MILGRGMEGVVTLEDGWVVKRFFAGKPTDDQVRWLQATLIRTLPHFPEPQWHRESEIWCGRYPAFESEAAKDLELDELRRFFGGHVHARYLTCAELVHLGAKFGLVPECKFGYGFLPQVLLNVFGPRIAMVIDTRIPLIVFMRHFGVNQLVMFRKG